MRAGAQGLAAKVLMGLVVFVLAVTGFGAIQLFSGSEPVVATVNGDDITERALEAQLDNLRNVYRDAREGISEAELSELVDRDAVLERLVNRILLGQTAEDLRLAMSEEAVRAKVLAQLGAEGFDESLFRSRLASMGHTPASFYAARREDEVIGQLERGLRDTSFVTDRELRRSSQVAAQGRDVAWLNFAVAPLMAEVEVSDEEVEEHFEEYRDVYVTEERFDFDIVRLSRMSLAEEVEIPDEDVVAAWEAEVANTQPLRHAAHILLEVTNERSAAQAIDLLAETRIAIETGADFAAQAKALSEDSGSADQGGDLGVAASGTYPPEFEAALADLEPGEMSAPVQTEHGVHLIKLVSETHAEPPTLDERRGAIILQLQLDEVQRQVKRMLSEMDAIAFEAEDTLAPLADEYGVGVEPLDGVTRRGRDGLLAAPEVRDALFTDEVLMEGFNSTAVIAGNGDLLVGRLRAHHPPVPRSFDEVRDSVRLTLKDAGARGLSEKRAMAALSRLASGATPTAVITGQNLSWERADGYRRHDDGVPAPVADVAFQMPAPRPGEREVDVARMEDGGHAVVLLSNIELADYAMLSDTEREQLETVFAANAQAFGFGAVLRTLRGEASIEAQALPAP